MLVFSNYLRFYFSSSHSKALRSNVRDYMLEFRRASCHEEYYSSCYLLTSSEFFASTANVFSSTTNSRGMAAYSYLKHFHCFGLNLLPLFYLSQSLPFFPFIWKPFSIFPVRKMEKSLNSLPSFQSSSFNFCVSKLFERIILFCLLFFLESHSIFSPH